LVNSDYDVNISKDGERIRENTEVSVTESLGYYVIKQHKSMA